MILDGKKEASLLREKINNDLKIIIKKNHDNPFRKLLALKIK